MNKLFIITGSFPYSVAGENTFLPQEIDQYSFCFSNIILVPTEIDGELFNYKKENVTINLTYSQILKNKNLNKKILIHTILDKQLWKELFNHYFFNFNIQNIKKVFISIYNFHKTKNIFYKILKLENHKNENIFVLTYWFGQSTYVLARLKNRIEFKLFSRAHGYDLYEERVKGRYFPFRKFTLSKINYIFTASIDGQNYLRSKYKMYQNKIIHQPLGIYDSNVKTVSTKRRDILHLVSCSSIVQVKRIDLLLDAILLLSEFKNINIKWTHIGNGPMFNLLNEKIKSISYCNLDLNIKPYINSVELFNFYRCNEIDLFINVSKSEGGRPVAIMEAINCGIPILATQVGGNPEIVNDDIGYMLPSNPTKQDIANKIKYIFENKSELEIKKQRVYKYWNENFNANKNYLKTINLILN